jgi:hypothetical protein
MPVIADDHEEWRASPLFGLMRLLGILLFAVLVAYWAVFMFYTAEKEMMGGPQAVVAWYRHIGTYIQGGPGGTVYISPWSAVRFLMQQSVLMAITVGLWFGVGRKLRKSHASWMLNR